MAAFAAEGFGKPCVDEGETLLQGKHALAKAQHVGIVVTARHAHHLGCDTVRSANTIKAIRGNAHADTRAAQQDATIDNAVLDGPAHFRRDIRLIHRGGIRCAIFDHVVARGAKVLREHRFVWPFPFVSSVVAADRYAHREPYSMVNMGAKAASLAVL